MAAPASRAPSRWAPGAILSGHGSVFGNVTVSAGGTLQPGGTIGTLAVGNATFMSGSTYAVEANASAINLIAASGLVAIQGTANVAVTPDGAPTSYTRVTTYTIVTATSVTGTFASASSSAATLSPFLFYSPTTVTLKLVRNDINLDTLATCVNQFNVANAINAGGPSTALYAAIAPMSDSAVQQSLDPLSGEIHSSLSSAILSGHDVITGTIMDRLVQDPPQEAGAVWGSANGSWDHLGSNVNSATASIIRLMALWQASTFR